MTKTLSKADIIERNRATAERFLNGTHSKDIADVAVIDDTVAPAGDLPRFSGWRSGRPRKLQELLPHVPEVVLRHGLEGACAGRRRELRVGALADLGDP